MNDGKELSDVTLVGKDEHKMKDDNQKKAHEM